KGATVVNTHYVSPAIFLKLFQDWAGDALERKLKRDAIKNKEKGVSGGIRIVLPSVPRDPLLRPGQPPRPLRILGQDPGKPIDQRPPDRVAPNPGDSPSSGGQAVYSGRQGSTSGPSTGSHEPRVVPASHSTGGVSDREATIRGTPSPVAPAQATPAPQPEDFEAQMIDDFERPICWNCLGATMIRDPEYGIKMVTCEVCGGAGRAPASERD